MVKKDYFKEYYQKNKEKIKKRSKQQKLKDLDKSRENSKKYYHKNKEKWIQYRLKGRVYDKLKSQVRTKANYYIKIPLNAKCELCSSKSKIERHHQDYNKPLQVILVCKDCHYKIHRKYKQKI